MNENEKKVLKQVVNSFSEKETVNNIRLNGSCYSRKINEFINIVSKEDNKGIDIYVKENTKDETVYIPVIVSISGLKDVVLNDFHIGKNSSVTIVAGCGIHNDGTSSSMHEGIHKFTLEKNSHVKYIEKHYGSKTNNGTIVMNPNTIIKLKENSYFEMDSYQIKGIDDTCRKTSATLGKNSTLIINEKIFTNNNQNAKTIFNLKLNGENSSAKVISKSVATENSTQTFISNVVGNNKCFAHISCDSIIKDSGKVNASPKISANNLEAELCHEATIGKLAGEELTKLMTLGLSKKEAEETILNGFLK